MSLQNIAYIFLVRLPERASNLVFRCDWRPIRFIMSFVFFGAAWVQIEFALSPQMIPFASGVYFFASVSSVLFGGFYLFVSTNDRAAYDANSLRKRYLIELIMFLSWIWVAYIDWYAHDKGMIQMDSVSWQHHIIINIIVSLTLCFAFLNALSLAEYAKRL